jgi:glucosamine 6-phosphate synthetase-like amidotransferase/phosphosugar isomerase protein
MKRGQWRLVHALLNELMVASASRGTDATGFAALDRRAGFVYEKAPITSPLFAASSRAWNRLYYPSCVVLHARMATHGLPSRNENNHPFVDENENVAVVVNGVSGNYRAVANDHKLRLTSQCDSEVVLRLVEAYGHPAVGLDVALRELSGGMAMAVLDREREGVWLARNEDRPLWVFEIAGIDGRFFCSTSTIARTCIARLFGRRFEGVLRSLVPLVAGHVVGVTAAGQMIAAHAVGGQRRRRRDVGDSGVWT